MLCKASARLGPGALLEAIGYNTYWINTQYEHPIFFT
jgi:hypothetical protein